MPKPQPEKAERHAYDFSVFSPGTLLLEKTDLKERIDKKRGDAEVALLQKRLLALQVENFLKRKRAVFCFEGWDAAGKGGCIRRLTGLMDPRGFKVWPISAPSAEEKAQHYLWRFNSRMPPSGSISIFDRTWYGRVLVERIEKFCTKPEWERAYDEINAFERMLTADGVRMVKFFIHIDNATQLERFKERESDPVKRYKIGEDDWRNRSRWKEYEVAYQEMFDRTHRPDAQWVIISGNDKRIGRIQVLKEAVKALEA